jgi:hypothetical protein
LSTIGEAGRRFDPPWIKVGQIYRRICLLRWEGLTFEAKRMEETELAAAAAGVRGSSENEADADARLREFYAEEEERVAEAIACAEVLVPRLSKLVSAPTQSPLAFIPISKTPKTETNGEEHSIADFIDEMLAQDHGGSR